MKGIITLCGSTRFFDHFRQANLRLTCADWIVLSIGIDTKSDSQLQEAGMEVDKVQLDRLHHDKIALSQAIMVIDIDGYVGESTRKEIVHAIEAGKAIYSYTATRDFNNLASFPIWLLNCGYCEKPIMPSQNGFCNYECGHQNDLKVALESELDDQT